LDRRGVDVKSKTDELEMVNQKLCDRDTMNTDLIASLSDMLSQVMQEVELLKKQRRSYSFLFFDRRIMIS